ncbi:penicillin-binding protein 2 [Candidatus Saccharibacteria bacterium]|nr:penicillin-binding protein 2 [Candidatus Saccharibacteria bacterium]
MKNREKALKILLAVAVVVVLLQLFLIQIVQHNSWVKKAEDEHIVQSTIKARRGEIYLMDGEEPTIAVMNETVWTLVIDPMLADAEATEKYLAPLIKDTKVAEFKDVFADKTRRYYVLARRIKRDDAAKIRDKVKEEVLAGVYLKEGNARVYPEGQLASSLLGFVNIEGEGQYGVEGALDKELAGENGVLKTITDVNNIALSIGDENVRVPAKDGKNVVLSIDRNVQYKMEQFLKEQMDSSHAEHAAGLVMNPRNGEIWALANLPSYDAANYNKVEDATVFINEPLETAYEPGSMCKTFSFSAAIDQGKMTPSSTYNNNGYLMVDDWKIENAYKGQLGTITMQTGLDYSLNTSSMTALMWLGGDPNQITQAGKNKLYEYYHDKFGFGEYTGIELFEAPGVITEPDAADAYNSRYANMTFGQGMQITMMQLAAAFSSVINGGDFYRPTIVAGEVTKDGEFKYGEFPEVIRQTVSVETSETMRQMLYGTRSYKRANGTDPEGYYIGGKTGTSQGIKDGAYTFDETVGNYIGFGGAEGELPEYVIMVKIWGEGKKMEGEKDAMPIFDKMNKYMIDYLKIKPKGAN